MHTLWKGSISFGLVNIPVKMHTATESQDFQFHYLHDKCHQRIRYLKKCPHCEEEVGSADLVKGYEYEKDHYVILSEEELAAFEQPQSRAIDILDFINLDEIDPIYYQKSYYLSPEDTAYKAYRLLYQAMETSGKVALARLTLRSKQHLACLRVFEQGLVLETMYYPSEIRHLDAVWDRVSPTEAELQMAIQLIENLARPFDPAKYRDEVREQLAEMIENKVAGESVKVSAAPVKGKVLDLMDALRASLAQTEERKGKPEGTVQAEAREERRVKAGSDDVAEEAAENKAEGVRTELKERKKTDDVQSGEQPPKSTLTPRKRAARRSKGA